MYYKIVDQDPITNDDYFLYHGVGKSRKIPFKTWLKADVKIVRDGTGKRYYKSGFHVFDNIDTAFVYLKRFKKQERKVIVEVECKGIRPKHENTKVLLCDRIRFI